MADQNYINEMLRKRREKDSGKFSPIKPNPTAPLPRGNARLKVMLTQKVIETELEVRWQVIADNGAPLIIRLPRKNLTSVSFSKTQRPLSWYTVELSEVSPGFYDAPIVVKI